MQNFLPHPNQGKQEKIILFFSWAPILGFGGSMYSNVTIFPLLYSLANPLIYSHAEMLDNNLNIILISLISFSCSKAQTSDHP